MKIVLLILVILFLIDLYIAEECLRRITRPKRYTEEEMRESEIANGFSAAIEAYEKKWEREAFEFKSEDVVLSGEFIDNPDGKKDKVVIIAHGHTVNRYASIKYADMFYRLGYNVVLYDERYHGRSTGKRCTLGQKEAIDLSNVIRFVKERFGENCSIGLHGESMGAATSLLVLRYEKPVFVIADCPFCDSERLFNEFVVNNLHIPPILVIPLVKVLGRLQYDYRIKDVSPIEAVRNSDVPICFKHGDSDKLIDCNHSRQMYKVSENPKSEIHLFEGADHACSVVLYPERYEQLLQDFLRFL